MKIVTKNSYNFKEVMTNICGDDTGIAFEKIFSNKFNTAIVDLSILSRIQPSLLKFGTYESGSFTYADYIANMLDEFYNRYCDYIALNIYDIDNFNDKCREFLNKFFNALNITYPIYSKLIGIYTAQENHLLDSLNRDYTDDADSSGSSTNRFNDTPQDGGAFEDDTHTTNINEIATSSESGLEHKEEYNNEYMIDRLNKINDNLRNLYMEWENKVARMLWLIPER